MLRKTSFIMILVFLFGLNLDLKAMDSKQDEEVHEPPLKKPVVTAEHPLEQETPLIRTEIDLSANHRLGYDIVVKLNLSSNDYLDNVNFLLGFPHLTDLDLSCCINLKDNYRPISQLTNLERLDLYGTNLTTTEYLIPLVKLQYLKVWCPDLGKCIGYLTYLNLKELDISGHAWKGLVKLSRLISLESITFRGFWKEEDDEVDEEFPTLHFLTPLLNLKNIDISLNQYITHIRPIVSLPNLTSLNISLSHSIKDLNLLIKINKLEKITIDRGILLEGLPPSIELIVEY